MDQKKKNKDSEKAIGKHGTPSERPTMRKTRRTSAAVVPTKDTGTKRTRRSPRDIHRLLLPKSTLQSQRLKSLFLQDTESAEDKALLSKLGLQRVHSSPNIYILDNFLSEADLEFLETYMHKGKFRRSFVDNIAKDDGEGPGSTTTCIEYDNQHRTSSFQSFPKRANARVAYIERKACELLGVWNTDCVEPLQLVRYLPHQFFGRHHDLGDLEEQTGQVTLPPRHPLVKRRLVTLFCYLNDLPDGPDSGGATYFPTLQCRIQPQRGRAVLFSNVKLGAPAASTTNECGDGPTLLVPDENTVHEGSPVLSGIKYGLNIWITED